MRGWVRTCFSCPADWETRANRVGVHVGPDHRHFGWPPMQCLWLGQSLLWVALITHSIKYWSTAQGKERVWGEEEEETAPKGHRCSSRDICIQGLLTRGRGSVDCWPHAHLLQGTAGSQPLLEWLSTSAKRSVRQQQRKTPNTQLSDSLRCSCIIPHTEESRWPLDLRGRDSSP